MFISNTIGYTIASLLGLSVALNIILGVPAFYAYGCSLDLLPFFLSSLSRPFRQCNGLDTIELRFLSKKSVDGMLRNLAPEDPFALSLNASVADGCHPSFITFHGCHRHEYCCPRFEAIRQFKSLEEITKDYVLTLRQRNGQEGDLPDRYGYIPGVYHLYPKRNCVGIDGGRKNDAIHPKTNQVAVKHPNEVHHAKRCAKHRDTERNPLNPIHISHSPC